MNRSDIQYEVMRLTFEFREHLDKDRIFDDIESLDCKESAKRIIRLRMIDQMALSDKEQNEGSSTLVAIMIGGFVLLIALFIDLIAPLNLTDQAYGMLLALYAIGGTLVARGLYQITGH